MLKAISTTRYIFTVLLMSLLSVIGVAHAEQKQQVGNFDIHYMALNSTFITPQIAKTYGIERSGYNGLVNITVLNTQLPDNPAVEVEISGVANNLIDARMNLDFKEIREGNAIYYIAEVPFRDDQEVNFTVAIKYTNQLNTTIKFKQKFYVE
ncbi:DUF4426 domain-containing protein [Shewanella saliphila]|uniref:Outer membrane protein n=2 Tax=Shewanella saliphila TaxID=2282698 RepID=A0ABQ2Q344_9GAMM|nr:DUF4426 domain-containing protein [Shewanella saliphila]MCL1100436.1 DUF4426 domain-containing protein [Shewanella saliphila]GGP40042.1 outer membrane protein [Shewanella saliphila]